jgi:hypothetical protein
VRPLILLVMDSPDHQIVINRPAYRFRDRPRRYRIEVDGVIVGEIRSGEELRVPATEGIHAVRALIDWSGSPSVEVTVSGTQSAHLVVRPAGKAVTAVLRAFTHTGWLTLEPA